MDWDERAEIENTIDSYIWLDKFIRCRTEQLTSWVSTFHKDTLPCRLAHDRYTDDQRGSFNWSCQVIFDNEEKWMVRFPRGGKVKHPDEKVEIEVATMNLLREHTDIPIPEVKAWGVSSNNKLGIGPFIITSFVEGVNLGDVLQDHNDPDSRRMRPDISDANLETIYRQIVRFNLQISKLGFSHIGSLSATSQKGDDGCTAMIHARPMSWKMHETLNVGGVDVLGSLATTFSSVTDYFTQVADNDWQHLHEQLNSVDDEEDARQKYVYWSVFKALIPRFVTARYDKGPFKLVCDDFGPANMIVNNAQELRIVSVIDWEWSYAGPLQLFWSPPRWLLMQTPNTWSVSDERLEQYNRYLDIYLRILEEEEVVGCEEVFTDGRPSALMRQCRANGSMWFHHIIWEGFNGPTQVPFEQLRAAVPDFDDLIAAVPKQEVDAFVVTKMRDLEKYRRSLAQKKAWYQRLKEGR